MAATGPCSPDTPKISSSSNGDSSAKAHAASTMMATDAAHANANEAHSTSNESAAAAAPPPHAVTDNSTIMPTYYSTKQSKAYTLANQLLKSGSFDDALATLEMALQFSREIVANLAGNNNHSDDNTTIDDDDIMNIEMHESLAPLYYLYGTTLLYSVEESDVMMTGNDNSGNPQQEDQQGGDGGDGAFGEEYFEVAPEDEEEEEDQLPEGAEDEEGDAAAAASSPPTAADAAEDMQIAWENLDLARSIVSRLVEKFPNSYHASVDDASTTGTTKIALKSNTPTNHPSKSTMNSDIHDSNNYTPEQQTELLLDLAQIHTRLGDIQRSNDNLLSCIDDYQHALTLRLETLGKYHKKVADSHFSLAAIYAQAPNTMGENEGRVNMFVNSLGGGGGGMDSGEVGGGGGLTEEEKAQYRQRSLEHYLACGVAFSGMLAQICGMNPDEFTTINDASTTFESMGGGTASSSAGMEMAAASASAAGSTTTTPTSSMVYTEAMSILRQRIATLAQSSTSMAALSQDDREEFTNVQEMLDEIQEAMDSAKETEAGLKILSETKANEIKKHEMKVNGGDDEENGGGGFGVGGDGGITTTIGFHVPSTSMALTAASTTATSSAAETATAAGPTMMVVKKKKKQPLPQAGEEDLSYKRTKTN